MASKVTFQLKHYNPSVGAEIKKTRPAVIVNDDSLGILPLKIIVPITEWKERYSVAPWMIRIEPTIENGLDKVSAADAFQVRSIDQTRIVRCLGHLSEPNMQEISRALALVLSIKIP
ncbi:MAG: type II toxin-antitoxin system PemK/MazF family toxin [Bacteroidota bacterium]|nr:type II toxin-antitoxin system PemK/MazF family toxin [Bacteroidota bacterium]